MSLNNHIYTGFYLYPDYEKELRNLENPKSQIISEKEDDFVLLDALIFLKGICHVFAYALNQEFKYDIYKLCDSNNNYYHHFCMSSLNGIDLFIDVRGITSDEKRFAEYFGLSDTSNKKKVQNLVWDKDFNENSIEFANYVINKNFDYYIDKIIEYDK